MKIILLPEKNDTFHYYRANLHCHSTVSDGSKTAEQLKNDYIAHGYSAIAFTDHGTFQTHNELTDDTFVALNGYEIGFDEKRRTDGESSRTCHLCLIALDKNMSMSADLPERVYTSESVNEVIRKAKAQGFYVTYNHPTWSVEGYPDYSGFEGMNAMEIQNYSSVAGGWDDDNPRCYEDFLRQGKRIFAIATDDNHNRTPDGIPGCDSYGGYIMIGAESLSYEKLIESMKTGRFYAATGDFDVSGPEILSLTYENGQVTVTTSPARSISITHNLRDASCRRAQPGADITEASFFVNENAKWFRITVTDHNGYRAYTNAYFLDELV